MHLLLKIRIQVLLLLLPIFCFAQQPFSLPLNATTGLPSNIVYNVYQDKAGFVWIATHEGLYKYDSFEYVAYKADIQTSVAGGDIKEDKYSRIWYQNFDGFIYYIQNNKLNKIEQNTPAGFISYSFFKDYLLVVQKKGIDVYDLKSLKFLKKIPININEAEHANYTNKNYYLITDDIIYRLDENLNLHSSNFFQNKKFKVKYIYPFQDKIYVLSKLNEEKKIYFFNQDLKFLSEFEIPEVDYVQGSNEIDNAIWIHSSSGTYLFDFDKPKPFQGKLFVNNSISGIIKDHQNNLWFSTINNGIYIVPQLKNKIYEVNNYNPSRIITNGSNGYILGTKQGELISLDSQFNSIKNLYNVKENIPITYIYNDSISNNMFFTGKGFYTVKNSEYNKIKNYNIALKEVVRLDAKYYAIAASGFCGLMLNPQANLNAISKWDGTFKKYQDPILKEIAKIKIGVRAKSVDYNKINNQLIFATNIGLFCIDPKEECEIKKNEEPFYIEKVICHQNDFFVLDAKGNLFKISGDHNIQNFGLQQNIPLQSIKRIKRKDDNLVITSTNQVFITNLKTHITYPIKFQINESNINDVLLKNNSLLIITDNGVLNLFINENTEQNKFYFHLNKLTVNNQKLDVSKDLSLNYNQNNIGINYSIIDFSQKKVPVYYRINNSEWILINNETRSLQFPSLSSGKYVVEFKIDNTKHKQVISFEITSPFWKKWWFYLVITLLVGFLSYAYFRWQSKLMKNQISLLNDKIELEKNLRKSMLASIKSQMNPHFFYNALNTIQAYIFTNDKQKANAYLAKFSKLTRIILEMSEVESVTLGEEIQALNLYLELEKMRFTEQFEFQINAEDIIDKEAIELPPMLIQPYAENAIKHGLLHREGLKKLQITFKIKNQFLQVTISDNGIGRVRSAELNKIKNEKHQSFATKANQKRLEILNAGLNNKIAVNIIDKYSHDGIASGTTVILSIPL